MGFGSATPTPPADSIETFHVTDRVVACDGGDGPLGHPRVWLRIVHEQTFCPYCSRVYIYDPDGADHGH